MQVAAFRQQLQKLGWLEGNNLQIDFRYAADDPARIRALAIELLGMSPDLMVSNSNFVTAILQSEVRKIPLVFVSVSDPEGERICYKFGETDRQCHWICQLPTFDGR